MKRRAFITGIASLLAAPAIVRADSLMKIAALRESVFGASVLEAIEPLQGILNTERFVYTYTDYRFFVGGAEKFLRSSMAGDHTEWST